MSIGQGVLVKDMGTQNMHVVQATSGQQKRTRLVQCPDAIIGSGCTFAPRHIQKPIGKVRFFTPFYSPVKHVRTRHVSNQQRILPRMKEKFAILLSTFGPSSTFSLLSCEICAKHSVGTRPFGLPIDSHTLLVRLGQVKTIKIYLLLRVPECATFLFYSFSITQLSSCGYSGSKRAGV